MKIIIAIIVTFFLLACSGQDEQEQKVTAGIQFETGTYAGALAKAKKLDRMLLIDFYSHT